MKQKKHNYKVMSKRSCRCGTAIKQNVVDRKPDADKCYTCFRASEASKGNHISTAREVRTGARPKKVKIPQKKGA